MTGRPRLIINSFTMIVASHNFMGLWRSPYALEHPYDDMQTWIDLAQTSERGKFDGIFFADHVGLLGPYGGTRRMHAEIGKAFPNDDALIMCSALAMCTTELSLGFTTSIIQSNPYNFARQVATLDRLSNGRAAWNLVTSALDNSYRNVGFDAIPSHAERYARADEYLEALYALWEGSWDDDAVLRDAEHGIYADPLKIHYVDFKGEYYSTQGPLHSAPSPQKTPFIYTPGLSDAAVSLAGKHAEALFLNAKTPEAMRLHAKRAHAAVAAAGRKPEDVKLIQSMNVVVGSTMKEAQEKYERIKSYIDPLNEVVKIGGIAGIDLSSFDPFEQVPVEELAKRGNGFQGALGMANIRPGETTISIHELAERVASRPIIGTPEHIVDRLAEFQDAGMDGINIADYQFHEGYVDFVDHVIPVLQDRGMAQREYTPGTFRQKVFGRGDRLPDSHPAARHRGAYPTSLADQVQ